MAKTYYFTYGTNPHFPYIGGWTEVVAPDGDTACRLFRAVHPDRTPGILNCAFVYGEDEFKKTEMFKNANFGERCRDRITVEILDAATSASE